MMRVDSYIYFLLISAWMAYGAGCANRNISPNHLGHHLSAKVHALGVVSFQTGKRMRKLEKKCLKFFFKGDTKQWNRVASHVLMKMVGKDSLQLVLGTIKRYAGGDGGERLIIAPGKAGQEADNCLNSAGFACYDFIQTSYYLKKGQGARLDLFYTEKHGSLKLGGFRLTPWRKDDKSFHYLWLPVHQSDMAQITGTKSSRFGDKKPKKRKIGKKKKVLVSK